MDGADEDDEDRCTAHVRRSFALSGQIFGQEPYGKFWNTAKKQKEKTIQMLRKSFNI